MLQLAAVAAGGPGLAGRAQAQGAVRASPSRLRLRDGTGLHVADWGAGKPIVFLHSWAMAGEMWDYQVAAFARAGRRCVTFDRRGHGRSDAPDRGYDYDTLADDLAQVVEGLDLRAATLVGHSMAPGEIVRYLRRHGPGRVERIVLLAPTTPGVARSADNPAGVDPQMFEATWAAWRRDFPKWIDDNAEAFFTPETSDGMRRWLIDIMLRTPLQVAFETNRAIVETDFRAELPNVSTPTLILHGDRDASAPLDLTGRPTAALIPEARLEVIPGATHGLFVTHLAEVNAKIAAFLQS